MSEEKIREFLLGWLLNFGAGEIPFPNCWKNDWYTNWAANLKHGPVEAHPVLRNYFTVTCGGHFSQIQITPEAIRKIK